MDELYLEECRARFEYEELMALKSELERRKRAERKEMEELREELASMHTLYQYRKDHDPGSFHKIKKKSHFSDLPYL